MTGPSQASSDASFLGELQLGRFRWDLFHPFPRQDDRDRAVGDVAVAELDAILAGTVDQDEVDRTGTLPDRLVPELATNGYLGLSLPAEHGGLSLSPYNVFRVLRAASVRSCAVGLLLSVHNGLGVVAYLPAIPTGPLRRFVLDRLAAGTVCGMADTEPAGAANRLRATEAVLSDDGETYAVSGEKVFIGNGRIAGLLTVSAMIRDGGPRRVGLCLVDTASDGFEVLAGHEFMGFSGAPSAALRLDRVRVPRDRMLVDAGGEWRLSPLVGRINTLARMYVTTAPSLGIAESVMNWSAEFLSRRLVDGRPLGEYEAVARLASTALADVFAVDSVARWCLLGDERADRSYERTAAKNIGTMTAWRVVDLALSLFGAEGYETARSKARRGAPAIPIERALRDIRGLRVAGGVDFHVDNRAARFGIFPRYYAGAVGAEELAENWPIDQAGSNLSRTNAANLRFVTEQTRRFAAQCMTLTQAYDESELYERESVLITVNRIADELFTMAVVLARASAAGGVTGAQRLAEVYCADGRRRVTARWDELVAMEPTDGGADRTHLELTREWLAGELKFDVESPDALRGGTRRR